jgi:hypothetical protein
VGSYDHVPSCQAPKATASRGLGAGNAYSLLKSPWQVWPEARALPRVEEGCGTITSKGEKVKMWITPGISSFLGWWPLLFSLEWWDHIRYRVYGFLTVYRWREPTVSRILSRSWWPTVPGLVDPDSILRALRWAGGQSRSIDSGQNMYSYVIVGVVPRSK